MTRNESMLAEAGRSCGKGFFKSKVKEWGKNKNLGWARKNADKNGGISLNHQKKGLFFFFWNPTRGEKSHKGGRGNNVQQEEGAWKRERGGAKDDAALTTPTTHKHRKGENGNPPHTHKHTKKKKSTFFFHLAIIGNHFSTKLLFTSTQKDRRAQKTTHAYFPHTLCTQIAYPLYTERREAHNQKGGRKHTIGKQDSFTS